MSIVGFEPLVAFSRRPADPAQDDGIITSANGMRPLIASGGAGSRHADNPRRRPRSGFRQRRRFGEAR